MPVNTTARHATRSLCRWLAVAAIALLVNVVLAGCGASATGPSKVDYTVAPDGVAQVKMAIVSTKYVPDQVFVPAGRPVRLLIDRQEAVPCSAQFQVPKIHLLVDLAPNAVTSVDLPALDPGTYPMTCGMNMMSGSITAVAEGSK